jgi:PKD repeat protein
MTENFMDYSPFSCYHAFTAGQAQRMQATLATIRSSLLDSDGCLDPCLQPVTAAFTAPATELAAGQSLAFSNTSTGATQYQWSVDGVPFASTTFSRSGSRMRMGAGPRTSGW